MQNPATRIERKTILTSAGRGPALLAFAGPPTPAGLATVVACAQNLRRVLTVTLVGGRPGGVIVTCREVALVAAAVRRAAAAIVVVAGATTASVVRRLAAATRRPVLIARTRQPWQLVLAASDLQTRGVPVIAAGAALAARGSARAVVLHNVVPAWGHPSASVVPLATARLSRRLRRLSRVSGRSSPSAAVIVSHGTAADRAIVEAIVRRDADVLVIGMRPPRPQPTLRCGDRLVAASPCNLVVVPLGTAREPGRPEVGA